MKFMKTFEGYSRQGEEPYPYPIYHEALKKIIPSVELFDENEGIFPDYHQTFAADINDFIKLDPDEEHEKNPSVMVGFASNAFDEGIDFLNDFESELYRRELNYKVLVGGIPTPWFGGRDLNNIDVHGDTLYVYCEDTKENKKLLKSLCKHCDEFNYYPNGGFYRIWWD